MRILVGYRGGSLDPEIVRVYNACRSIRGFVAERQVSVEEIRRLWFGYSTFDPNEFAVALIDHRVYGFVFAWVQHGVGRVWVCVDPGLPRYYLLETLSSLLSWARHKLVYERVSIVRIGCGYEFSGLHNLLREIIGLGIEATTVTLMEYSGKPLEPSIHPDIIIRRGTLDDIPGVVEVYNEAFRKYDWFNEWNIEDAVNWYSTKKLLFYVAVDKETNKIIGFVDAEERKGFDGNIYGYVYTLAVHPNTQGKGVGKALLQYMLAVLGKRGVKTIYLDAVHGLEKYYARQGFRIVRRSKVLLTELSSLPLDTPRIMMIE